MYTDVSQLDKGTVADFFLYVLPGQHEGMAKARYCLKNIT
jgi:hypothetical protein